MDGRPLSLVEHPVLNAAAVGRLGHLTAQRVQLPHQLPLARAADGGIAGHVAHRVEVDGKHHRRAPHPRRSKACLNSGVPRANDGDLIFSCQIFHGYPRFLILSILSGEESFCKYVPSTDFFSKPRYDKATALPMTSFSPESHFCFRLGVPPGHFLA